MSVVSTQVNSGSIEAVAKRQAMDKRLLKETIKKFHPDLSDSLVGAISINDAIGIVSASIFLQIQKEGGVVSNEALQHFFTHLFWSVRDASIAESMYEEFFKQCQLSAEKQKQQMGIFRILESPRKNFGADPSSLKLLLGSGSSLAPKEQGELAYRLMDIAAKCWDVFAPYLSSLGKDLIDLDQLPSLMDQQVGKVRKQAREAKFVHAKELGLGTRIFWQKVSPIIHQLNLYVRTRLPIIAKNASISGRLPNHSTAEALQKQIKKIVCLADDLYGLVSIQECKMSIIYGIHPQSPRAVLWTCTYFHELANKTVKFFASVFPELDTDKIKNDSEMHSLFDRRLKVLKIILDERQVKDSEDSKCCNMAIEEFKKSFHGVLDSPSTDKDFSSFELDNLGLRCVQMLESLKRNPWHVVKEKEDRFTNYYREIDSFPEVLNTRRIVASLQFEGYKVSGEDQQKSNEVSVERLRKMNLIARGCIYSLVTYHGYFSTAANACQRIADATSKLAEANADENLLLLQAEEEAAERTALERAEQSKKKREGMAKHAAAALAQAAAPLALPRTTPPSATEVELVIDLAPSPYNTQSSKLIFNLRQCVAEFHQINLDRTAVNNISLQDLSIVERAVYNQLNAMDSLIAALQIYENCSDADKASAIRLILLWGYLVLEQAATAGLSETVLVHDLAFLLDKIGIAEDSVWRQHVRQGTFYFRYPWNFTLNESNSSHTFALRHIREGSDKTVEEFNKHYRTWVEELAKTEMRILSLRASDAQRPILVRIQALISSFQKSATSTRVDCATSALSKEQSASIVVCENALKQAFEGFQKRLTAATPLSEQMRNVLLNARQHLNNLQDALSFFRQFPQQRFLHMHLHFMLFSAQYFAENIGYYLSLQNGDDWRTHSIAHYSKMHHLADELSAEQQSTLHFIDIGKGSEYYANLGDLVPESPFLFLEELKIYAKEAFLMGEGAVPGQIATPKGVSVLRSEVLAWVRKLIGLAATLTEKRL